MGMRDQASANAPAAIELHIEELVLHGFSVNDRFCIGDAVERELSRLIEERGLKGLANEHLNIERLDGGAFQAAPGAKPQSIGIQLAQAIHRQISPMHKQPPTLRRSNESRKKIR
jgi:hypothetical protein